MAFLLIHKDEEVERGIRILTGKEVLKFDKNIVQFSYDRNENHGWTDFMGEGRVRADQEIGDKGNLAVKNKLAMALAQCKVPGLHIRFIFCNLDQASVLLLAHAVSQNDSIGGFSCLQNPCNFDEKNKFNPEVDMKVREAIIACPSSKLTIWNNNELEPDVVAARRLRSQLPKQRRASVQPVQPSPVMVSVSSVTATVTMTKVEAVLDGEDEEQMLLRRLEEVRQRKQNTRHELDLALVQKQELENRAGTLQAKLALNEKNERVMLELLEEAKKNVEQAIRDTKQTREDIIDCEARCAETAEKIRQLEATLHQQKH